MLCSDLERYLEAYLDGRLGRSRTTILRRHLGMCGPCRARVERLRRFEREIGRQLGMSNGQEQPSVWQGLEVDLVRSFSVGGTDIIPLLRPAAPTTPRLRPPTARGQARSTAANGPALRGLRRRLSRFGGVLAVALALGTVYEFARAWLVPQDTSQAAVEAYRDFVAGDHDLAVRTDDTARLQDWLKIQLGQPLPLPPAPDGFRLVGGARAELAQRDAAVIVYAARDPADTQPTLLFVQPTASVPDAAEPTPTPVPREVAGYSQLAWEAEPFSFHLVSAEPPARLQPFVP